MIFIRLTGLFFAFVQITLLLRLVLPFVEVPRALQEYVPTLLEVTEVWLAPVLAVVDRFELNDLTTSLVEAAGDAVSGPDEFEPIVLVAMVALGRGGDVRALRAAADLPADGLRRLSRRPSRAPDRPPRSAGATGRPRAC